MSARANLALNGSIQFWKVDGVDIFAPQFLGANGERGGASVCAPMFSVQQRPVPGCKLSMHGLMMHHHHGKLVRAETGETLTTHFPATDEFAWEHTIEVSITVTDASLTHTLKVTRAAECTNENEMPISLAFHPYFATFRKPFSFSAGNRTYTNETLPAMIVNSDFAIPTTEPATITTAAGTITIAADGHDEWCLWSDDPQSYICIEPIYQYREFGLPGTGLKPGESKTLTTTLTFTARRAT